MLNKFWHRPTISDYRTNHNKTNFRLVILTAYSVLFLPITVFAQQGDFGNIIAMVMAFRNLLNVLTVAVVALALVFFLWGLTVFILNAGSEDKRAEGKQRMLWGIIAFVVMIGIWGIVNIFIIAFGIGQPAPAFIPCLTPPCD